MRFTAVPYMFQRFVPIFIRKRPLALRFLQHRLWGDLEERRVLVVVMFPHLKWGVNFLSSPTRPPLMAYCFRKGHYLGIYD